MSDKMEEEKICLDCGQKLEPITFYVHRKVKEYLEWLIEDRKSIAGEIGVDAVLARLITLEATKRWRIAVGKQQSAIRREQRRAEREELKAIEKENRHV